MCMIPHRVLEGLYKRPLTTLVWCVSQLFELVDIPFVLFNDSWLNHRTGRMAYVKVMLMGLSCMIIGTKICDCLVMEKMVDDNCFRFSLFIALSLLLCADQNRMYINLPSQTLIQ